MRLQADRSGLTVIEHNAKLCYVVARVAVAEDVRARSIGGEHAADRALNSTRRIGCETPTRAGKLVVQFPIDNARLNAHRIRAYIDDGTEVPTEIEDDAVAQRLASQARAGAP